MRKIILNPLILIALSQLIFAQSQSKNSPKVNISEREVRAVIKQWADSIVKRDMNALDKILSKDLIVTSFDGTTRGKTEELEVLKPNPNVTTHSVENKDVRIKIYSNTAVVTAVTEMLFVISEKTASSSLRYTAVFVKQNGRWQIVALQTARIAKPGQKMN